ncbi:Transcriptional regulator GlxA family, contains an amidase domain and an AraC-type DNA-binding HTH domain [Desulfatibacillum alkenivorans DSM 16219]|jgi:transcriptional regulator GlxA family with amidase domain|uniref:Transcriptional regulator GlxA family, contains an amidase domain and an AraC-type DNA-binding HTH domain n=1 Tax=Desulfatibacillum alkenivorans DSM 16219 TaxID=1121393 RepID=A0A1M6W1Q1_9BACT|nr:helix-turn-helix domain-containing protein [Desulfatibacillum alkenivorans]SHK87569.1 Transcriptional regulator GlxA family, contains an amidase domain and an AraC-type DNA-binding HTH domain [Desulfatibacillum alkenivorans DSM 16219]
MPHITLLAYEHCAASAIYGCIDAFGISNRWYAQLNGDGKNEPPLFQWDIVSLDGGQVEADGRVIVTPHASIHDIEKTDFILVPGFLPPIRFIGAAPRELADWLRKHHEKHVMIGSTCTGTFLLAETGILDGKVATTNLKFSRYFKRLYPKVKLRPERILTEDGGVLCSGATTSFWDLCIYLIEKFGYEELADVCSKALLMEPRNSQSPYSIFEFQKDHTDEVIKEAQSYLEEKFTSRISVEALACDMGVSPRHFVRRFKQATGDSPLIYLQRVRIEAAKHQLEKTAQSIEEITQQVGYEDPNSFRKLFKKTTGLSPREYRNRFTRLLKPVPMR